MLSLEYCSWLDNIQMMFVNEVEHKDNWLKRSGDVQSCRDTCGTFLGIEKLKVCKITRNCAAVWYQFMNEYKEASLIM